MVGWLKPGRRRDVSGDATQGTVKVSVVVAVYNPGEYNPVVHRLTVEPVPAGR